MVDSTHASPDNRSSGSIPLWGAIVGLALAYALVGKAALLLAIPPGYATAIFPASGVALAALLLWGARLWPGVFLGSFMINLWGSLASSPEFTANAFTVSSGIATGATLQALFGTWLIRKYMEYPVTLAREGEVARFLFLGGAVSCLVSASMGVAALWLNGTIPGENALFSWWTWWVGDCLGILIGTPIILTFFGTPKQLWRGRLWSVALPMGVTALGIIPVFIAASHWESDRVALEFRKQAALLQQTLESKLQLNLDAIHALRDFSHGVERMNFPGFSHFAKGMLSRHPSLHALSYNPLITDTERAAFEAAIQREVDPAFAIRERRPQGGLMPAEKRPEYVAVAYIQPLTTNRGALGFDVASNPVRKAALDQARDMNMPVATGRITLVQETRKQAGILAFIPMYSGESPPASLEERRALLLGYAVGVFRLGDLLASALTGADNNEISARLYDEAPKGENFLTGYSDGEGIWEEEKPLAAGLGRTGPWWVKSFDFGGRQWRLELSPTRTFLDAKRSWGAWFVLAGGLLFASLLGAFLLIITGRTSRIEEQVQQRTAQFRDSESRMQAIVATAVEAIITIDEHGVMESVNNAALKLFGYSEGEMVGNDVSMLMPPPHRDSHNLYVERFLTTGEAHIIGKSREVEGLRKDGSLVPIEISVSDVKLADRRIFTGILHDLTERKKADQLKNEFVSTVSHELRTPLTSIQGSLGLIMGGVGGELSAKAASLIDMAHRNSDRLVRLINDILDLEKIEAGKMSFKLEVQEISPLARQALETNKAYAEKHDVTLVMTDDLVQGRASVDGDRLAQVMANLLSNAAKFSPKGGEVEISLTRENGWLRIAVRDRGQGIPEAFRAKLFQKFSQADSGDTRQTGGTGLGLAISKVIMEKMGGDIGFETQTGVGSTFFITLPEFGAAADSARPTPGKMETSKGRILICEDEPDIAQMLGLMLAREGYDSDIARNAAEAKALVAERSYRAMTLDLMLPDQNGLSLLKELRDDPDARSLPVVVISAWVDQAQDEINGDAIHVTDWLSKPLDEERLKQAIENACGKSAALPRILHIEDDRSLVEVVAAQLERIGTVEGACTLAEARVRLAGGDYDLILLDINLPDGSGSDLLPELRDRAPDIPVVIFSGDDVTAETAQAVNAALVKSRTSHGALLETIMKLMNQDQDKGEIAP